MAIYTSGESQAKTYLPPEKIAALNALMGFLSNPLAGAQAAFSPLLADLVPSENAARRSLTDTFRAAGQSGSGAFAQAARQLEGDILGKRSSTITEAGLKYLAPLISGYTGALAGIPALATSESTSWGIRPPSENERSNVFTSPGGYQSLASPSSSGGGSYAGPLSGGGASGTGMYGGRYSEPSNPLQDALRYLTGGGVNNLGGGPSGQWTISPDGSVRQNLTTGEVQLISPNENQNLYTGGEGINANNYDTSWASGYDYYDQGGW